MFNILLRIVIIFELQPTQKYGASVGYMPDNMLGFFVSFIFYFQLAKLLGICSYSLSSGIFQCIGIRVE